MEFVYQSSRRPDKEFKLRLFRNGMLQIPGVTECYPMSEVRGVVDQLIYTYRRISKIEKPILCLNQQVALCIYIARFPIAPTDRLDIVRAHIDHKKNPRTFFDLCTSHGLECIHYEVAVRRVVLYVKFVIPKPAQPFSVYKAQSTSNRRSFKSITFQITQKGIIIIQGSTGVFPVTKRIIESFQLLAKKYFPRYTRTL